jgi:hypothetical protein
MPAAAFAVHQLRYWLAFGNQAGAELQRQGHSYLHSVVPWLVFLIALATGAFLRALGNAFGGRRSLPRYTMSFAAIWLLCAASLVAIYVAQGVPRGPVRDRASGWPGRHLWLWRLVIDPGGRGRRPGARRRFPRRPLGAARSV